MRANEQRVVMKHLRARRLVIRVVESHQSIAQERSNAAASLGQFRGGVRRLDGFRQIGSHLRYRVPVAVQPERKLASFPRCKKRLGHLEFTKLSGKGEERVGVYCFPLRHFVEPVAKGKQRIKG